MNDKTVELLYLTITIALNVKKLVSTKPVRPFLVDVRGTRREAALLSISLHRSKDLYNK